MGKKITNATQSRKGKELKSEPRKITINLHKACQGVQFKKKAPQAVKAIKALAQKNMFTKEVRIDPELNKELWKKGIRNLVTRVTVIMERKKNEDDEEEQKMYTLVKLAPAFETQ